MPAERLSPEQPIFGVSTNILVTPEMVDQYGEHLNHKVAYTIFEDERFQVLDGLGVPKTKEEIFEMIGALPVIRHYETDYVSQAFLGDMLSVSSSVFADRSTIKFIQSLKKGSTDIVRAKVVFGFANRSGRATRTPNKFLALLEETSLR